jgi:hypothetical protein
MRLLPARGRAARLWITAAFLATTWASETQGFPDARHAPTDGLANTQYAIAAGNVDFGGTAGDHDFEMVQASRFGDKSVQVAQATTGDTEELQKALEQEHRRAKLFEMLLTLHKTPAESTRSDQVSDSEYAELRKSLQQEPNRLDQDLAAARRDVEMQTVLAAKANDDAIQLKQAAESGAVELRKSLQQERERAERLERDLAASRRDVETQTALASKASQEASQLKQVVEIGSAELKRSLRQEHDRAEALARDLSTARTKTYAYEAHAPKAGEQAADPQQAAERALAELRNSLQQERELAVRLEQDLAAARRDVETQTALAAKANEDATLSKQVAERSSAKFKRSLQKDDSAEVPAQDLSMVHTTIYAYEAQTRNASDRAASLKQAEESSAAELRKSLMQEWERAARLQRELAAARRRAETRTALAVKAGTEAARLRQVAEDGPAELKRRLQLERDSAARLEGQFVSERNAKAVSAASAVVTVGQVAQDKQIGLDAPKPVVADQATGAKARGEIQLTPRDAAEVARLVARASVLLGQGDIGSARIVLERAAETGSAQASFTLAETYDPLILGKWGTYGTRGDAAMARDLYAKAKAGGIKEATERLDALRR